MSFEIGPLIAGIALFLLGIRIVLNPKLYSIVYRYTWDLTGFNVPFGIAVAVAGTLLIWSAFTGKSKRGK